MSNKKRRGRSSMVDAIAKKAPNTGRSYRRVGMPRWAARMGAPNVEDYMSADDPEAGVERADRVSFFGRVLRFFETWNKRD